MIDVASTNARASAARRKRAAQKDELPRMILEVKSINPNSRLPRPVICARIAETRVALRDQWDEEHPESEPGDNPFIQENVAKAMGVSMKSYTGWERQNEPSFRRLRQIAIALQLDADYFLPAPEEAASELDTKTLIALVRESVLADLQKLEQLEKRVAALEAAQKSRPRTRSR